MRSNTFSIKHIPSLSILWTCIFILHFRMASAHARRILRSHMQQYSKEGPYISPHGPHTGFKSLNCINGISSWSQGWQGSFPFTSTMYLALQITVKAARTIKDFILALSDLQVWEKENISLKNWFKPGIDYFYWNQDLPSTISVNFFPSKYSILIYKMCLSDARITGTCIYIFLYFYKRLLLIMFLYR